MCILLGDFTGASSMERIFVRWRLLNFLQNLSPAWRVRQGRAGARGGTLVLCLGPAAKAGPECDLHSPCQVQVRRKPCEHFQ